MLELRDEGYSSQWKNIATIYNKRVLFLVGIFGMFEVGSIMQCVACTLFMLEHGVEPKTATLLMCIISGPEALQFLLSIFVDQVSIFGKRGHIVLATSLSLVCAFFAWKHDFEAEEHDT